MQIRRLLKCVVVMSGVLLHACATHQTNQATSPAAVDTAAEHGSKPLRVSAVGDMMLAGSAEPYLQAQGYTQAFAATQQLLQNSQVVIGNLEGPLTDVTVPWLEKRYVFRSPPQAVASALAAAGFHVVSLANNHVMDYGVQGLLDTQAALTHAGIGYVGAGADLAAARRPVILTVAGRRLGFLAYSNTFPAEFWANDAHPGTAFGHAEHVRADVSELKKQVDFVLVQFHWGQEGSSSLRPYQPLLAHTAIDAGASVVIGHHPHVLQGIERYQQGVIFYSLGNFGFGSFSPTAKVGGMAHIELHSSQPPTAWLDLLNVDNFQVYFQPSPLPAIGAEPVFAELQALSAELGTRLFWVDGQIRVGE